MFLSDSPDTNQLSRLSETDDNGMTDALIDSNFLTEDPVTIEFSSMVLFAGLFSGSRVTLEKSWRSKY